MIPLARGSRALLMTCRGASLELTTIHRMYQDNHRQLQDLQTAPAAQIISAKDGTACCLFRKWFCEGISSEHARLHSYPGQRHDGDPDNDGQEESER